MINRNTIDVGDKVYHQPDYYKEPNKFENGIVKEILCHVADSLRVVYNCSEDWDNYQDYTSALTNVRDLYLGWK